MQSPRENGSTFCVIYYILNFSEKCLNTRAFREAASYQMHIDNEQLLKEKQ